MKEKFSSADRLKWERLEQIRRDNQRMLRLFSLYLNQAPRFLTAELVESLARDCGISNEDAFRSAFAAACGLNSADSPEDRRLERLYIQEGVHLLSPDRYRNDPYYRTVRFPEMKVGKRTMTTESYQPYEPFVCGHPILQADLRELPQLGVFAEEYRFHAILENGVEWMTVTPNEIETMKESIESAHGRVVTFGLGLGYFAFCAAEKKTVEEVTVIERDAELIRLFQEHLLPMFPHREKIRIVCGDAFDYAEHQMKKEGFDFAFVDLWHDPSDGLELYLRMKRLEPLSSKTVFSYWIEPTLLSYLREMLFASLEDAELSCFDDAFSLLQNDGLRRLAPELRKE